MSTLLALDNSLTSPGVALFTDGLLTHSDRLRQPQAQAHLNLAERVLLVAQDVVRWAIARAEEPYNLAWEWPQVYTAAKSKGDPNDLLGVVAVGAAVAGILAMGCQMRGTALQQASYTPAQWIGQVPKATKGSALKSARALRVLAPLDPLEQDAVLPQHDAIDAIGIGLYHLGRLRPRRVFPGGDGSSIEPPTTKDRT